MNAPPQSSRFGAGEAAFKVTLNGSALLMAALLGGIFITLLIASLPSIREFGWQFLFSRQWDPVEQKFGAYPFLVGTLLTSFLAILISTPFSLAIAIFLGEYFRDGAISAVLRSLIELLAGIPSVIYGFWGVFYLVPLVRAIEMKIGVVPYGVGVLTASIILAVMIVPYSASVACEVIRMVPSGLKEAGYALGSTKFEVIKDVIIPYGRSGIFAGIILALGRALGETMAVTMVIGNMNAVPTDIFGPANTMASVIANEFNEADGLQLASLIEIGLLLFVVSTVISVLGKEVIKRMGQHTGPVS